MIAQVLKLPFRELYIEREDLSLAAKFFPFKYWNEVRLKKCIIKGKLLKTLLLKSM
jgi:hypothetical protein